MKNFKKDKMPNIRARGDDPWRKHLQAKDFKMPYMVSKTVISVYMCLKDTNKEALGNCLEHFSGIIANKGKKVSKWRFELTIQPKF